MGIPLVDGWRLLATLEKDTDVKSFLQKLDENWFNLPGDVGLRVTASLESRRRESFEWNLLYHLTYAGEATGLLDKTWLDFVALVRMRERFASGENPRPDDFVVLQNAVAMIGDDALQDEVKWMTWSTDPFWTQQNPRAQHDYDDMRTERWLKANAKGQAVSAHPEIKTKLFAVAEMSGTRDMVPKIIARLEAALTCI